MSTNSWQEFERFAQMMETAPFRFAVTMKNNPPDRVWTIDEHRDIHERAQQILDGEAML